MYNFFVKQEQLNNLYEISGGDLNHIKNVLRMKVGEQILVTFNEQTDLCEIVEFKEDCALAKILEKNYKESVFALLKVFLYLCATK